MENICNESKKVKSNIALINLITQTPLTRFKSPTIISNENAMIVNFARNLKKHNLEVDIFVSDAYKPLNKEDLDVNIYYLSTYFKWLFLPTCIPFTPNLIKLLKNKYDIVVCSELFQISTLLTVISKIISKNKFKVVVWQEMARHQEFFGQFISKCYHSIVVKYFLNRYIDLYIPRGELAKRFLLNQGIDQNKISSIISHGIDSINFYFDPNISKEEYIFSPSRLVHSKGIDILLKAFAIVQRKIQNIKLITQGDGPKLIEYQELAKELKIQDNVIFCTNRISHEEMKLKYQKALVTVIASRKDLMIFSVMESLACGTPIIISTGVDCYLNFLDNDCGLVFENENIYQLSEKLFLLINNNCLREKMSQQAIIKSKNYDNYNLSKEFLELLIKLETGDKN